MGTTKTERRKDWSILPEYYPEAPEYQIQDLKI